MQMRGVMTALVTPFRTDRVDEAALRALVRAQVAAGIHGLIPCGTTGEAVTLSADEWELVVRTVVEEAAGRCHVMAGIGGNDTRAVCAMAKRAEALGAHSVLAVTPYYNKPTQEGLFQHFSAVAAASALPVCVYNVPGRTGVNLEPATMGRLMAIPAIQGIKDATGNLMVASELRLHCGERLSLLSGDDFTVLPFLAQGGDGMISVATNVVPEQLVALYNATQSGQWDLARSIHFRLYPLFQQLFIESNPIPVKTAMHMLGRMTGELRLPLCAMKPANQDSLGAVLASLLPGELA